MDESKGTVSNWAGTGDASHTIAAVGFCPTTVDLNNVPSSTVSGTSFAAPAVAGMIYLADFSRCATWVTAEQCQAYIRDDAYNRTFNDRRYGFSGDPLNNPISGRYYGYLATSRNY